MANALNIILTIVLLLAILGILISAHEAGHLLFAKIFGVYCNEFSIGFGPKIFSHRRKKGETTFSLRAIPLGGYVSMYSAEGQEKAARKNGEEYVASEEIGPNQMTDPEGNPIPFERSLERKSLWKRIIILLAGVVVNFVISFLFCLIYGVAFPQYITNYRVSTDITFDENNTGLISTEYGNMSLFASGNNNYVAGFIASFEDELGWPEGYISVPAIAENLNGSVAGYVIDNAAVITSLGQEHSVTAIYYPAYQNKEHDLFECLTFFANIDDYIPHEAMNRLGIKNMPNMEAGKITLLAGDEITLSVSTIEKDGDNGYVLAHHEVQSTYGEEGWNFNKIKLTPTLYQTTFGEKLKFGCEQWVYFFPQMGEAIKQIFRLNFDNVGGIVAMGASINSLTTYMGVGRTFFLYGALISLNLGFINLLPFPGLDGWQIVVAIVEKAARKRIPLKTKQIIQIVGFAILAVLAIFILVKDIIRII